MNDFFNTLGIEATKEEKEIKKHIEISFIL